MSQKQAPQGLQKSFTILDHATAVQPALRRLSKGAERLLQALNFGRFSNTAVRLVVASCDEIASEFGVSERQAQRYRSELARAGYIEIDPASAALWITDRGSFTYRETRNVSPSDACRMANAVRDFTRTPFVRAAIAKLKGVLNQVDMFLGLLFDKELALSRKDMFLRKARERLRRQQKRDRSKEGKTGGLRRLFGSSTEGARPAAAKSGLAGGQAGAKPVFHTAPDPHLAARKAPVTQTAFSCLTKIREIFNNS